MWQGGPWSLLGGSSHLLSRLYPLTLLLPLISSLTTKYLVQDAATPSWAEENAPKDRVVLGTGSMEQFVFQIVFHHLVKHIFGLYASTLFPFTLGDSINCCTPTLVIGNLLRGLQRRLLWFGRDVRAWDGSIPEPLQTAAAMLLLEFVDLSQNPFGLAPGVLHDAIRALIRGMSHSILIMSWGIYYITKAGCQVWYS